MDIKCGHCLEPWDASSTYARFKKCDECDGTGTVECDERISDAAPGEMDFVCQDAEPRDAGECEVCSLACVCECEQGEHETDGCTTDGCDCPATASSYLASCTDDRCIDGTIYEQETCECGEEILNSWYRATAVIGDGFLACLSCARRNGWITDEKPCDECNGTGQQEEITDIGDHSQIALFNAGKGCPCCEFGAYQEMKCDTCDRIEFGWEGRACFDNRVMRECSGHLRPSANTELAEQRAKLETLRELNGADNDGLAVDIDTFLK